MHISDSTIDREKRIALSGNAKTLYGEEADFLNQSTSELTKEFTSKTHALDIYLHDIQYLVIVAEGMGNINTALNKMTILVKLQNFMKFQIIKVLINGLTSILRA